MENKKVIKEIITEEKIFNEIALHLKRARKMSGLTMREASEMSGCSEVTIVKAENSGMVTAKVMAKLFSLYNYTPF